MGSGYQGPNYGEQGGARWVIGDGGSLDVESGGEIDIESGGVIKVAGTDVTANITEGSAFWGSTDISAAEAEELTDGSTTDLHQHALADGANDVTATADEVNAACDGQTITAAGAIGAKRFVAADLDVADVDATGVIGVAPSAIEAAADGVIATGGLRAVTADCPLGVGDPVKVGVAGRATKHTTSQHTLGSVIGEATAFTQPVAATALEVVQADDVEADRGRGIVIVGSAADGSAITETITLDATDTSVASVGTTEFTKVSGVYTEDGEVLGAQNVTVQASGGGAGVVTLAGASSEIGADIPAISQEAYCNELTLACTVQDNTYLTVVGVDSDDQAAMERVQLDNETPSNVTTSTVWRYVERICLGEFTNAAMASAKTNSTTDTAAMKCGGVVTAAAARGDDAIVLVKPNL